MYKNQIKTILISIGLILVMTGCKYLPNLNKTGEPIVPPPPENTSDQNPVPANATSSGQSIAEKLQQQSKIKKFANLEEAREFIEANGTNSNYGYGGREVMMSNRADMLWGSAESSAKAVSGLGDAGSAPSSPAAQKDYSRTNIQVEGVDEADIIKTDGEYIYAVTKNSLFIIKAFPPDKAEIISKIEFKSRPEEIYVSGNFLSVYGPDDKFYATDVYKRFRRQNSYVFLKVFDITDKKQPQQVRDLQFEGSASESRLIGDYLYLVTTNYQYYIMDDEPLLPRIMSGGKEISEACASGVKCLTPDIYYFDIPYSNLNYTSVTAINIKNNSEDINSDVYLMSNAQNFFVSQRSIYITYTKYISEYELEMEAMKELVYPRLSEKDRDRIAKIEAADNYILSAEEKRNKIQQIIERFGASLTDAEQTQLEKELQEKLKQKYADISKELEKTVIHKIAINGAEMEYKTFGEVTGQVLNQFSMDESGDYFRIATTKNTTWSKFERESVQSYNNMYILDQDLKIAGALEKIAEGERIYSVRFMGNRAYMVTFKQTDPLFAIDLTDPRAPKILGALKIPGFSNYLHPYDNDTIIGIGKETKENQWGGVTTGGVKLSLFDVADVSAPKEIDNYVIGSAGSDSIALHDHKAFLFSKDKNLLVIPATLNEAGNASYSKLSFSGALVFSVDKTGFTLKGRIDHSDGGQPAESDFWWGYNYYHNNVLRSLYIDQTLYTFSNNYIKMNALSDLKEEGNIILKKEAKDDYTIVN